MPGLSVTSGFAWALLLAGAGLLLGGLWMMIRERRQADIAADAGPVRAAASGTAIMAAGAVLVGMAQL